MTNFFRHDLNLNNKRWHRLLKVIRFISMFTICFFYFIVNKPHYIWKIHSEGTTIERLPENWYYKVWDLVKKDEYIYNMPNLWDNIWNNTDIFNKNKKELQENNKILRGIMIFCSNNRKPEYLKDIKDKYWYNKIIYQSSIDWDTEIKDLEVALQRINNQCIWIKNDENNLILNNYVEPIVSWWHIYSIEECNYIKITFLRLWELIKIIAIYSIVTLILYYKWIVYIICWSPKNHKKRS